MFECVLDRGAISIHTEPDGSGWSLFVGRLDVPYPTKTLSAAAHAFAAHRKRGVNGPRDLYGDYILCVRDSQAGEIMLARDPAQSLPLYYYQDAKHLLWASSPEELLRFPGVSSAYDPVYLTTYMVLSNLNWERTPYRDIRQVPGGHCLHIASGTARAMAWWSPPEMGSLRHRSSKEYEVQLRALLQDAVQARLPDTNEPVCIALSRGMDSAAIAATAAAIVPQERIRCVSMSLSGYPEGDESLQASKIAQHLSLPHEVVASQQHPGDITDLLFRLDEPSSLPDRYNLWGPIRDACSVHRSSVLLTGAGGEHFTSPPYYLADLWRARRFGAVLGETHRASRAGIPVAGTFKTLLRGLQKRSYEWSPANRLPLYSWLRFPELCHTRLQSLEITHPVARDSYYAAAEAGQVTAALQPLFSSAGIELRHPLLDRRIVEFACALPVEMRLHVPTGPDGAPANKPLLRRAYADSIPPGLTHTNANLRKYSGWVLHRSLPHFLPLLDDPPPGLEAVVDVDGLRKQVTHLMQDRGEKRPVALTTVLASWLAAKSRQSQSPLDLSAANRTGNWREAYCQREGGDLYAR